MPPANPKVICWPKKIIHMDMDAYFAAVEQRDNPALRGKPVVVGGDPRGRGVVSTASYEARVFGIRSAMPAAHALRLCPQAVFLRPDFQKYQAVSNRIMAIFKQHTKLVQAASLDEAYLDVTHHRFGIEDPVMAASMIKQNIRAVTNLTASAGVAANLLVAKIASDFKKPDGLTVVIPGTEEKFLAGMPVRKIPGIGPVTEKKLQALGIHTCGELAALGKKTLAEEFGKTGIYLYERALGRDDSIVETDVPAKQYSMEETFARDTRDLNVLKNKLYDFAREVFEGVWDSGRCGKTVVLKVKYFDFEQITRSKTLAHGAGSAEEVAQVAWRLLQEKTAAGKKPVRLLGLGLSGLEDRIDGPEKMQSAKDLFGMPIFKK